MPAPLIIRPQPGPQEAALSSPADIVIFGGSAGGGKSFALLLEPIRHHDNSKFGGAIFRRTSPQLAGAGSLWEEAQGLYRPLGARMLETPTLRTVFPSGAQLQFLHLQHASDVHDHQGKQYAFIGLDELTHFEESQFWYLVSRMRTTSGVRSYMRCTCNPDPDSFVKDLILWWLDDEGEYARPERSGVVRWFIRDGDAMRWGDTRDELLAYCAAGQEPMSFTFIMSSLDDNPALTTKDPGYRGRLYSLPQVERERLLKGNWKIRAEGGKYVSLEDFAERWTPDTLPRELQVYGASDFAVTEPRPGKDPDFTEHAWAGLGPDDKIYILDWWYGQTKADVWVDSLLDLVASRPPLAWYGEDGQIRKAVEPFLTKRMQERGVYFNAEWVTTATGSRSQGTSTQGYDDAGKRAKSIRGRAFQALARQGRIVFPASAPWLAHVLGQLVSFPVGKDDAFDAISHLCMKAAELIAASRAADPKKKRDRYALKVVDDGEDWMA